MKVGVSRSMKFMTSKTGFDLPWKYVPCLNSQEIIFLLMHHNSSHLSEMTGRSKFYFPFEGNE